MFIIMETISPSRSVVMVPKLELLKYPRLYIHVPRAYSSFTQ